MCRVFQQELKKRRIDWTPTIEVSALELVAAYVHEGFGIGLSIAAPGSVWPGVSAVTLENFPPITIAAVWRKLSSGAGKHFVEALSKEAERIGK